MMDPRKQIGNAHPLRQTVGNLLLGPNGADVAYLRGILALQSELAHVLQGDPEGACNHLDESAAAGCTLVIHYKIDRLSVAVDPDSLSILTSDINHRPRLGEKMENGLGMARDLG